jgi:hypothetical protein
VAAVAAVEAEAVEVIHTNRILNKKGINNKK